MSTTPATPEVAAAPAPLANFGGSRFAPLDATVTSLPARPRMEPYVMWFNQKTGADMQKSVAEQLGAVAFGTPVLVDNGTYRRLDVGCATLLLGEYRYFAKYDFDSEGMPLTAALPEEPEGNDPVTGYKEAYQVLCLHCFADPNIKPVVSVSRMLAAQCAWVSHLVAGVLAAATPAWLAEQAKRDPDLGAALASVETPRLRVVASLSGVQRKKYAQTKARVYAHTRETWGHLSRALIEGADNPEDATADIDAGRASLEERVREVEAVIEETQYRASTPGRKKR